MKSDRDGAGAAGRRSARSVRENDTAQVPQLAEELIDEWVRDAALLGDASGAGVLLAGAAEAAEFALLDVERAADLYARSAIHPDADPRAFAGLRRLSRGASDWDFVVDVYERETATATDPAQAVFSAVVRAWGLLRHGGRPEDAERALRAVETLAPRVSGDVLGLWRSVLEDVYFVLGQPATAIQTRVLRWRDEHAEGERDASAAAAAALALAGACEAVFADPAGTLEWYRVAFEAARPRGALRALVHERYDAGDFEAVSGLLADAIEVEDDADRRSRFLYELGLIRARRLGDRAGGIEALASASTGASASPLIATTYLGEVRAQQGFVATEDFVDAVGVALEFSASGVERADAQTHLATRLLVDFGLQLDAAQAASEALIECPGYLPAIKLLGTVFTLEGRWSDLAALGEEQLEGEFSPTERARLHERLAELYQDELEDPVSAERHLRAGLDIAWGAGMSRRLERVLSVAQRWDELFDHFRESALRVESLTVRAELLHKAAGVAEDNLGDRRLAVEVYRELLEFSPTFPSPVLNLSRLLESLGQWDALLDLNERSLDLRVGDPHARAALLCHSAEVARRLMRDPGGAETYYRRALDESPTYGEALHGLGHLLAAQERWDELVEMTEAELAATRSPADKRRCLLQLGELHATRTGLVDEAVRCFESLAAQDSVERATALLWLDRIYQSMDATEDRLRVLVARTADARDPGSRARLSFQIAELHEWGLRSPAEALRRYVDALEDSVAAPVAVAAIGRLWNGEGVTDSVRSKALDALIRVVDSAPHAVSVQALEVLVERAGSMLDPDTLADRWSELAQVCELDVLACERAAVWQLTHEHVRAAEGIRSMAPVGPVENFRIHWSSLEDGIPRDILPPLEESDAPWLAGALYRESGETLGAFDGVAERDTFVRIAGGFISFGELCHPDGTESGLRLAVGSARALGDVDLWAIRGEALVESMCDPVRKMRALLDLASEADFDDARRAEWLREAGALGVYRRALRDELYDSMTEVGDFEGLEGAIAMELTQASLQRTEAAKLGLRRGRALDVLSRRSDAIEVLGDAGVLEPANADIALERSRIEQLTDRLDDARRTLEACLGAGVEGVGRLEVLNRVADLHLMQGGRVERAIEALEEAYANSEGATDWALRLASAHARYGDATRAAELLEAQLASPPRAEELVHWHLLATIYSSRLSAPEDAAEILWRLFRTFPERRSTVQWLEDFYKEGKGAAVLADGIGNLLTDGDLGITDAVAARLWEYVGELNLSVLERMPQAEAAFRRARQLGERSAANALRLARSVARQSGRVGEAVPLVMEALAEGTEARVWEDAFAQLESLFDQMQLHARLRVARQVRLVLGANVEPLDAGMRRDPGREIAQEVAWSHLVGDLLHPEEIEVLRGSSLLAEKVFHRMDPTIGQVATRRMNRAEFPAFINYLETACRWLGVQVPSVWLAEPLRGARVLSVGKAWVNATRVADAEPLRARFWAGWIAGLVFSELAPYTWVDEPSVEDFFAAVAGAAGHGTGGTPAMMEEVGALMRIGPRRAAVTALDANPEFLAHRGRTHAHHARCVADRAGYLMCGDLRTAVEEILGAIGWDLRIENARTRETILRDDRMRSLLLFAISDAHFLIRYESGLAERPRVFV